MQTFRTFLEYTQIIGKGYASLNLNEESVDRINIICSDIKLHKIIPDLHITLMYDRSNPKIKFKVDEFKEYPAKIIGVKTLGEPDSKWYAICLELEAPEIETRHEEYKKAGFTHSYPKFIPHLSLKYQPTKEEIELVKSNLQKFKDLHLVFTGESLKEIKG